MHAFLPVFFSSILYISFLIQWPKSDVQRGLLRIILPYPNTSRSIVLFELHSVSFKGKYYSIMNVSDVCRETHNFLQWEIIKTFCFYYEFTQQFAFLIHRGAVKSFLQGKRMFTCCRIVLQLSNPSKWGVHKQPYTDILNTFSAVEITIHISAVCEYTLTHTEFSVYQASICNET